MTPENRKAADQHYEAAETWAADRNAALRSSRRVAWIVAIVAVTVSLAEAVALATLMPLKTVVPYTLLVDRQTGFVQTLKPLEPNQVAPDAALTQSFLVQYVIAREGFDFATIQNDYRKVALWSAEGARGDYIAATQVSNPDSPLVRLPRKAVIETRVRSVSALGNRTALVRFETVRRDPGSTMQPTQSWVAIINYRFSNAPMSVEDRFINPLGFQVVSYRRNAETLPATEVSAATSQMPSSISTLPTRQPTDPRQPIAGTTLPPSMPGSVAR